MLCCQLEIALISVKSQKHGIESRIHLNISNSLDIEPFTGDFIFQRRMANINSKSKPLPSGAVGELAKVADWLQTSEADFQTVNNIKICRNTQGLANVTTDLLKQFSAEVTSAPSENRVTAIHFDQPAVVPVEQGWTVDLIPVHTNGGTITVESEQLNLGQYVHLKKEARVSGEFFAVLLLSQLGT
ncbi:hypothetical protein F5Y06DRAFT_275287 [Hypoxylon sp. FL0890]|nr:hypothetical protein F5Y06DRAFT_275287 [Hypoxylon sp. FL0890]